MRNNLLAGALLVGGLWNSAALADVIESGTNNPEPIASNGAVIDTIGFAGGTGTLIINKGTQFNAAGLSAGDATVLGGMPVLGNGTITIDGAGTLVTLGGSTGLARTSIGSWGTGSLTVSGGAVVDGASLPCTGFCGAFIGNAAGSTGTLTVTGAGSTFSNLSLLNVGLPSVFTQAHDGFTFGTPGGTTTGTVNVLAGGMLTSGSAAVGGAPGGGSPAGTELSLATVLVSGVGSTWNVLQGLSVGQSKTATGTVTINNGGLLNLGTVTAPQQGILIGLSSGHGTLNVDGGTIKGLSTTPFVIAGQDGTGTLNITNGGSVGATFGIVGNLNGGVGALKVDGAGSQLSLTGGNASSGGASLVVGFASGAGGSASVSNGGQIHIDSTTVAGVPGGIAIGGVGTANNSDSGNASGTMTVTGAGSRVSIVGSGAGTGLTVAPSGTGQLNILDGGKVTIQDKSGSVFSGVAIGGDGAQLAAHNPAGSGTITVSGAGSALEVTSPHGAFFTGFTTGGSGTLNVMNGGTVAAAFGTIGVQNGSTGAVTIAGAGSTLAVAGSGSGFGGNGTPIIGAAVTVGQGGTGTLNLKDGGLLSIKPDSGVALGGLAIGGNGFEPAKEIGGTGTVNVDNAKIEIVGDTSVRAILGGHNGGNGTLNISNGGQVTVSRPANPSSPTDQSGVFIGRNTGGTGTVTVSGTSSLLDGGSFIGIGVGADKVSNAGTGTLTVRDGSTAKADQITLGSAGTLGGNGTIAGNISNNGGTLHVGASPDPLHINGNYLQTGGKIQLEVDPDGHGGFLTDTLVFDNATSHLIKISNAIIDFAFVNGADPIAFEKDGLFNLDTFLRESDGFSDQPLSDTFSLDNILTGISYTAETTSGPVITNFSFTTDGGVSALSVPEPGGLALVVSGIGLVALLRAARRRPSDRNFRH